MNDSTNEEFLIKNKADLYTGAWIGTALDRTERDPERDLVKITKLCKMIASEMVKSKKSCKVSFVKKTIKPKMSSELTEVQLKAAQYIVEHPNYLNNRVQYILDNAYKKINSDSK